MKILVAVVPVAGHVGPVTGLVADPVRRDHQVRVCTGACYQRRFTGLGGAAVAVEALEALAGPAGGD